MSDTPLTDALIGRLTKDKLPADMVDTLIDFARSLERQIPRWREMKSAPMDRTPILICGGIYDTNTQEYGDMPLLGSTVVFWERTYWRGDNQQTHDVYFVHRPSRWMPLPEPPQP